MKKSFLLIFALTAVMLITTGCASRRQLDKMEVQIDRIEESNATIEQKLAELDSLIRAREESQREFLASLQTSIGDFEDRLSQLNYKLDDLYDRLERLQQSGGVAVTPVQPADTSAADDTTMQATVDHLVIFNAAFKSLQAGNYEIAVLGFKEYITSFPNTDLADDAQFWLGECYYQMNPPQYQKAREEFQKVLENYPESDKRAGAMFKLARSHEELGSTEEAIALYREILEKFPQTAEANRARVQLENLGETI